MLNNDLENKNSEINLNVKIPKEQTDVSFSFRELVLTIHFARKAFISWCCIGLILGIAAAAGLFLIQRSETSAEVSVAIILNYSGASENIFPSGEAFDVDSFYTVDLWDNALKKIDRVDINVADAMSQTSIIWSAPDNDNAYSAHNTYILTVSEGNDVFKSTKEKEVFLTAFCTEYKSYIVNRYFNEYRIGMLHGQQLKEWVDITKEEIMWDQFSFSRNFDIIDNRYRDLSKVINRMFDEDPAYRSSDGKSFSDFAKTFENIVDSDLPIWIDKLNYNIYIRNVDRFMEEYQFQINSLNISNLYHLEILGSYNELLSSFRQTDADGIRIEEAIKVLMSAQKSADSAAEIQRQLNQMSFFRDMLNQNNLAIHTNSSEAEAALTGFIDDLDNNQRLLHSVIYEYYKINNERDAENAILYANPSVTISSAGANIIMLIAVFAALTFLGVFVGFLVAAAKKHLPRK